MTKALTLQQPWASLCVPLAPGGKPVKTIETRGWSTKYRGRLLVHAANRPPGFGTLGNIGEWWHGRRPLRGAEETEWVLCCEGEDEHLNDDLGDVDLPLGAIVGSCELVDVVPIIAADDLLSVAWQPHVAPTRADDRLWLWKGPGPLSTGRPPWLHEDIEDQRPYGDFTPGRYAWLLEDAKRTDERCPACWGRGSWWPEDQERSDLRAYCTVCDGNRRRAPIPAKGKQGLWEWNP